jgi:hypothetical protein
MPCNKIIRESLFIILILTIANIAVNYAKTENIRTTSFQNKIHEIENIQSSQKIDLLILGDSRSAELQTQILSSTLNIDQEKIFNASVTAGSWFSSYALLNYISPHLHENSTIVLCVSEYWLERPDVEKKLGLYPTCLDYIHYDLGYFLTSFTPIALKKEAISNRINHVIHKFIIPILNKNDLERVNPKIENPALKKDSSGLAFCNVELWFEPISNHEIIDNLQYANKTISLIKNKFKRIIFLYLPNATSREEYLEKNYPNRQHRFFINLTKLSANHSINFLNLKDILTDNLNYKDFHHWNESGSNIGTMITANHLKPYL